MSIQHERMTVIHNTIVKPSETELKDALKPSEPYMHRLLEMIYAMSDETIKNGVTSVG